MQYLPRNGHIDTREDQAHAWSRGTWPLIIFLCLLGGALLFWCVLHVLITLLLLFGSSFERVAALDNVLVSPAAIIDDYER